MSTMATDTDLRVVPSPPEETPAAVPSEVLGVLIFILTEIMLFAGFVSAFMVSRASAAGAWPPPDQPRLPVEETALNTAALLLSGAVVYWAGKRYSDAPAGEGAALARLPMIGGMLLGVFFVGFQGVEWVDLLSDGLTVTSSTYGAFFYLLVGTHALHAVGGLMVLVWMTVRLQSDSLSGDAFWAGRIFWYFVVLLWPFLYWQVYLA